MISIHWFRRDLRLEDNHALYQALESGNRVLPIFIFDRHILDALEHKKDARLQFIHQRLLAIKKDLQKKGSDLLVLYGYPEKVWESILETYPVAEVYTNEDYEPYAIKRDQNIAELCSSKRITFKSYKDHVFFNYKEVLKKDGMPYTVYTPYSKVWKSLLAETDVTHYPSENSDNWHMLSLEDMPTLEDMGFEKSSIEIPPLDLNVHVLEQYAQKRDIPSVHGTSRLGIHLRFGSLSVRKALKAAITHSEKWLNELIWREFYMSILAHFPHVANRSFRPEYDQIEWLNQEEDFERWKTGRTGYPIVDAGMRELLRTGFMHNRVRMIVASFLSKHLLIDWRWGEAWFAAHLLDYELASNNGGWQWAAGSGVDAAPYFRVFNPTLQTEKFDPQLKYIKQWVPEYGSPAYPKPMVDHKFARERCLSRYQQVLKPANETKKSTQQQLL